LGVKKLFIQASDGVQIPLTWFAAQEPQAVFLMLPALGIQARLYEKLGQTLANQSCSVCLMEQRGHGLSPLRPGRANQFGVADFLEKDIPATLDWLQQEAPGQALLLGGHSLGGHLSSIYSNEHPQAVQGVVHLACGFPYHGDFPPREARLIRRLCRIIPWFRLFPGYFPGKRIGFAGNESMKLMNNWRGWASCGSFDFDDRSISAGPQASFSGPVLSISFENDNFSSEAAVDRALSLFDRPRISKVVLGPAEQGEYLGHSKWARQPDGVANAVLDWMQKEVLPGLGAP